METIGRPSNIWKQLGRLMLLGLVIFFFIFLIGSTLQYLGLTRICCYQSCCQALWANWKDGVGATSIHMSSLFAMSQLLQTCFHLPICAFRLVANAKKLPEASVKTFFFYEFNDFFVKFWRFHHCFFPSARLQNAAKKNRENGNQAIVLLCEIVMGAHHGRALFNVCVITIAIKPDL